MKPVLLFALAALTLRTADTGAPYASTNMVPLSASIKKDHFWRLKRF